MVKHKVWRGKLQDTEILQGRIVEAESEVPIKYLPNHDITLKKPTL